jgi:hypothetical protein
MIMRRTYLSAQAAGPEADPAGGGSTHRRAAVCLGKV